MPFLYSPTTFVFGVVDICQVDLEVVMVVEERVLPQIHYQRQARKRNQVLLDLKWYSLTCLEM